MATTSYFTVLVFSVVGSIVIDVIRKIIKTVKVN